ncbi:uncharacterized protein LOC134831369 [Culicoides brevitarsis]|uniref:uncharacterized protein LOC134831369 n=1 Tax=Culicoides brevitarsis TaxID=469753 RepID=UPI00307C32FB
MKFFVIFCSFLIAGIYGAAYDWKTPEGCSCSCPATYAGPFPPPSSVAHLRDPYVAGRVAPYDPYTATPWNRAAVDPYYDPYRGVAPAYNRWNQPAWNATWNRPWVNPAVNPAWVNPAVNPAWNRNQWGAAGAWNRQPAAWNANRWNSNVAGNANSATGNNDNNQSKESQ